MSHNSYNSVPCDIIALASTIWNGKFHFVVFFYNTKLYLFADKTAIRYKSLLVVSPLGKTTRCDPGMLPIVSFPQSKEQATEQQRPHPPRRTSQGALYLIAEEEL